MTPTIPDIEAGATDDAPEYLWMDTDHRREPKRFGFMCWTTLINASRDGTTPVEYVRADCLRALEGEIERIREELARAGETLIRINELRGNEGAAVTICCDNPELDGQPLCKIYVTDDWTDWNEKPFTGDSVLEALRAACDEKVKHG